MGLVPEAKLAEQLGLSRDELRYLRETHCTEGAHFRRERGHVFWTPAGIASAKKEAGAGGAADQAGSAGREKDGAADAPPVAPEGAGEPATLAEEGVIELTVFSVPARNTRILDARKKDGRAVRVRVSSNVNFMPGMTFQAKWGREFEDVYVLEGRCPRWRGKW